MANGRRVALVQEDGRYYDCIHCPMGAYNPFGAMVVGCAQPCDEDTLSWPPCPEEALYVEQEGDIICSYGGVFVTDDTGRAVRAR